MLITGWAVGGQHGSYTGHGADWPYDPYTGSYRFWWGKTCAGVIVLSVERMVGTGGGWVLVDRKH